MNKKKIKICYVLPEYDPHTATHFYHKYALLKAIQDQAEVRVVSVRNAWLGGLFAVLQARAVGFQNFYAHYSFKGALAVLIVKKIFRGRIFYWNCGMPWLYTRSNQEEKLFRFIMRNSIFVTGTAGLLEEYIQRYDLQREQTRVVPNTIEVERFGKITKVEARERLRIVPDKKVILFNHHLSRRKGADKLPALVREFKNKSNILFIILGSGPLEAQLHQELSGLEAPNLVRLEGPVPNERIPEYLAAADIFIMPSEEEGMPNALLEAMAAGVPFVAADVGGVKEMTPSELHEFVLPYDAVYDFFQAITRILEDTALKTKISAIEQSWVQQYDISRVAPTFLELFRNP